MIRSVLIAVRSLLRRDVPLRTQADIDREKLEDDIRKLERLKLEKEVRQLRWPYVFNPTFLAGLLTCLGGFAVIYATIESGLWSNQEKLVEINKAEIARQREELEWGRKAATRLVVRSYTLLQKQKKATDSVIAILKGAGCVLTKRDSLAIYKIFKGLESNQDKFIKQQLQEAPADKPIAAQVDFPVFRRFGSRVIL